MEKKALNEAFNEFEEGDSFEKMYDHVFGNDEDEAPEAVNVGEVTRAVPSLSDLLFDENESTQVQNKSSGMNNRRVSEVTQHMPSLSALLEEEGEDEEEEEDQGEELTREQKDRTLLKESLGIPEEHTETQDLSVNVQLEEDTLTVDTYRPGMAAVMRRKSIADNIRRLSVAPSRKTPDLKRE